MLHVETFTFLPQAFAENTYVLSDDSGECVVVDPGCYTATEQAALCNYIDEKGLQMKAVWLTHAHIDHVFGLQMLKEKYGMPILCHEKEMFNVERGAQHASLFGFSMEPVPVPDVWIEEGEKVKFGTTEMEVLFTPGHSPGHVSFYHAESAQLFSGDVIFRDSFGRVDLPGGSLEVLRNTILNTILKLPGATKIYAGHMGPTTVDRESSSNPMLSY